MSIENLMESGLPLPYDILLIVQKVLDDDKKYRAEKARQYAIYYKMLLASTLGTFND